MTRMSDSHAHTTSGSPRICAEPLERSALARAVHDSRELVRLAPFLLAGFLMGCVIPPDLSVSDGDAGVNSPPAILAVRSDLAELPEGNAFVYERGPGSLNVTLYDTDVSDTLYVRVFVDYDFADPTNARSTCTAACTPPCTTVQRSTTCDLAALCTSDDVTSAEELFMAVQVFDREPLEFGSPRFKAMPPGGLTTSKSYKLTCVEPTR